MDKLLIIIISVASVYSYNEVRVKRKEDIYKDNIISIQNEAERQCNIDKVNQREKTTRYIISDNKITSNLYTKVKLPRYGEIVVSDDCKAVINTYSDDLCNITINDEIYIGRVNDNKCIVNDIKYDLPNVD